MSYVLESTARKRAPFGQAWQSQASSHQFKLCPRLRYLAALAGCLLALTANLPAATAAGTPSPKTNIEKPVDPRIASAAAMLRRMHDYLRNTNDLEFRTMLTRDDKVGRSTRANVKFQIREPNLFRVEAVANGQTTIYLSDGKSLTVFRPRSGKYMQMPARDTIIGTMYGATGILAQQARVVDFFWTVDYLATIGEDVRVLDKGSVEKIDGQQCRRLSVDRMDDSWDVWVAEGDLPLPCKLVSRRRDTSAQVQSNYFEWTATPKFAADTFVFTPPAGARKVENYELD